MSNSYLFNPLSSTSIWIYCSALFITVWLHRIRDNRQHTLNKYSIIEISVLNCILKYKDADLCSTDRILINSQMFGNIALSTIFEFLDIVLAVLSFFKTQSRHCSHSLRLRLFFWEQDGGMCTHSTSMLRVCNSTDSCKYY